MNATGEASAEAPFEAVLARNWDDIKPAAIYELRAAVYCEKKLPMDKFGPKELIALETCLFKIGDPPNVGCTGAITFIKPCNETAKANELKVIVFHDKCRVKVLADDPAKRYDITAIAEIWNIGTEAKIKSVPGTEPLKPGEATDINNAGSFFIDMPGQFLNVYYANYDVVGGVSSSSSGAVDLCEGFRDLFFRTCRFTGEPPASSSSSSSSPQ